MLVGAEWPGAQLHVGDINQSEVPVFQQQDIAPVDRAEQDAFCMQACQESGQPRKEFCAALSLGQAVAQCGARQQRIDYEVASVGAAVARLFATNGVDAPCMEAFHIVSEPVGIGINQGRGKAAPGIE